jgi:VIT1/CCC1 family predicted Fe2+/Mn2+ transporter
VNILGIVLGVTAATNDLRILFVAALAALGAESISMGAVAYTSTMARRKYYLRKVQQEQAMINSSPKYGKEKIKEVLREWGYKGKKLGAVAKQIASNPEAVLKFVMSFKLNLSPIEPSEPKNSFLVVFLSTVFGSAIPLLPFLIFTHNLLYGAIGAVIISAIVLFVIGYYEAKATVGSLWRSGLQLLIIGVGAGFAGYLIGHFIGAIPV